MKMSKSCMPPVQPYNTSREMDHPRFEEYLSYKHVMACQFVTASTFSLWLNQVEEYENGSENIFEVISTTAFLKPGWYKNVFGKRHVLLKCHGPFSTKEELEQSWKL